MGSQQKKAAFYDAMTWKCDDQIFPNNTSNSLAKDKKHQDLPWKASTNFSNRFSSLITNNNKQIRIFIFVFSPMLAFLHLTTQSPLFNVRTHLDNTLVCITAAMCKREGKWGKCIWIKKQLGDERECLGLTSVTH